MMKTIKFSVPIIFSTLCLHVYADLLSECQGVSNTINKSTPQAIDNVTTLLNAVCFQEGNTVTLNYRNKVNLPAGAFDQGKLNNLKPSMLSTWCTDPTQRQTLNQVNIRYTYADASGKFIGNIDLSKRECK